MADPRTCPECGLYYHEWLSAGSLLEPGEALIPNIHECPEPYPYDVARALAASLSASGVPIHPRMKAAIVLGLKQLPDV